MYVDIGLVQNVRLLFNYAQGFNAACALRIVLTSASFPPPINFANPNALTNYIRQRCSSNNLTIGHTTWLMEEEFS